MPRNGPAKRTNSNTLNAKRSGATEPDARLFILPYGQDLLAYAARHLISAARSATLTDWIILLPDLHHAAKLRRLLLQTATDNGFTALLGPTITTLDNWLNELPWSGRQRQADHQSTRLMLVESLREYPHLYGSGGPWPLADSLIVLFDELTRQRVHLPDSLEAFTRQLHCAYQTGGTIEAEIPLTREARLVYTLWHAWQEQQHAEGLIDPQGTRIQRLLHSLECLGSEQQLLLIGHDHLSKAEADWLRQLMLRGQASLLLHGSEPGTVQPNHDIELPHFANACRRLYQQLAVPTAVIDAASNDHAFDQFIAAAFPPLSSISSMLTGEPSDLASRARTFASRYPRSPVSDRLIAVTTSNPEQQARYVDVQIRQWFLEGKRDIAVICADSRMSRRLRALLERAGIHLRDQNGWTLSTSRAAAVIERLLQTAEEDYDQVPFLDLLKSPFVLPDWDEQERLNTAWQLERDIIQHENIARGLSRYRRHIRWRQRRLGWATDGNHPLNRLLDRVEPAIQALQTCVGNESRAATDYLQALDQAISLLGLDSTLTTDPAGERLLGELHNLSLAVDGRQSKLTWLEFRNWLGQALEQAYFLPPAADNTVAQVQLLTLTDTPLGDFDALIFASADHEHLPALPTTTPFFNDAVRHELGLETQRQHHERALNRFRNLLQRAKQVVFSWHRYDGDKPVNTSPWVTLLDTFHQLAYNQRLHDPSRAAWGQRLDTQVQLGDNAAVPAPSCQPAASAADVLPLSVSASRYQRLVDCPYLFFAADCLGLRASERIRLTLEKSDYGQRVHRILQAFHSDVHGLPGPFTSLLDDSNREQARDCLEAISRAVFAEDLEDNALHRGWLRQWLDLIPAYLDWQCRRQLEWRPESLELAQESVLQGSPSLTLTGRLDRVDQHIRATAGADNAIIDYKTGNPPVEADILNGEAVQLPFYALLHPDAVYQVEYLQLAKVNDRPTARTTICLSEDVLSELSQKHQHRLRQMFTALTNRQPLPAWGDKETCSRCDMSGLCRRQTWEDDFTATDKHTATAPLSR